MKIEKNYFQLSLILAILIAIFINYLNSYYLTENSEYPTHLEIYSPLISFGNRYCSEPVIESYQNGTWLNYTCEDKRMDIFLNENNQPIVRYRYSEKNDLDLDAAIGLSNFFLDFMDPLNCELFNTSVSDEMPEYLLEYSCGNIFYVHVFVFEEFEGKNGYLMPYLYTTAHPDKDELANLLMNCDCETFEPTIFECRKYKTFDDKIEFRDCKDIRTIVYWLSEVQIFNGRETRYWMEYVFE